jgi:hypothetical protein
VRTISALFQAGGNTILPTSANALQNEPLEVRVASISAEIAAAIAQAQARGFEGVEEGEDDEEQSESGQEAEVIAPNTSGIRDLGPEETEPEGRRPGEEENDSDAFPVPLRARKSRELVFVGSKRKR